MGVQWVRARRVWGVLPAALLAASCGGSSAAPTALGVAGAPGAAGMAGSAGMVNDNPRECVSSYEACECGAKGEGFRACDASGEQKCNCDAPVPQGALTQCAAPCGGNLEGQWRLKQICGPTYAKGNCKHPVYESTGTPEASGLSFGDDGVVAGSIAYGSTLLTQLTAVCATRRSTGRILGEFECDSLAKDLAESFTQNAFDVTSNQCSYANDACSCKSDLHASMNVSGNYAVDPGANLVTFGGGTFGYCVKDDALSLQLGEDGLTFTYEHPSLSLPFKTPLLPDVKDVPISTFGVSAAACTGGMKLDTDARTLSCAGGSPIFTAAPAAKALYLPSLFVPFGSSLTVQGSQSVIIVADVIEIGGTVTFQSSGPSTGLGAGGTNQGGGGGGNCTAGGDGGFFTGQTAALGGPANGAQGKLNFGGQGGGAIYTSTANIGPAGIGGGGIAFLAASSISVSGTINVSGGDAKETGPTPQFGGGGGAGGTIILEAPQVTVTDKAKLRAGGGRGGGGKGGAGSALSSAPGTNGGSGGADTLGGGGGGAGRIAIRTDSDAASVSALALTPPYGVCTTVAKLTSL